MEPYCLQGPSFCLQGPSFRTFSALNQRWLPVESFVRRKMTILGHSLLRAGDR